MQPQCVLAQQGPPMLSSSSAPVRVLHLLPHRASASPGGHVFPGGQAEGHTLRLFSRLCSKWRIYPIPSSKGHWENVTELGHCQLPGPSPISALIAEQEGGGGGYLYSPLQSPPEGYMRFTVWQIDFPDIAAKYMYPIPNTR